MSETWDAIVIGAGPAGMSAAALLTEHDVSVLLVDQNDAPGGQIYRGLSGNRADARLMTILGPDYARGSRLLARLERSGATLALSRTVWRIEPSGIVWAKSQDRIERLAARFIIIAAGAMERPVPISGWTLPGVMTVGALQIMLKSSGLVPEDKIVLAGTGPLLYLYGKQCVGAGVKHLTILDTASRRNRLLAVSKLPAALQGQGPRYLLKGVRILRALRQQGVRMHTNVSRIAIEGTDSAVGVSFDSPRGLKRYSSPLIALHEGVLPDTYLARSIGCRHEWDEGDCAFRPTRNQWGETDRDRVYVVGDASGIMGANASAIDGEIAALGIATRLGKLSEADGAVARAKLAAARKSELSVRGMLNVLYRPAQPIMNIPDTVVVCRCEVLRGAQIREAIRAGASGPNQIKAYTRSGMGPCQGRLCGPSINHLSAQECRMTSFDAGYFNIRSPLTPIPASFLTDYYEQRECG